MLRKIIWIAGIVLLVAIALFWTKRNFDRKIAREVTELFAPFPPAEKAILSEDMLTGLPACVQLWIANSGLVGREMIYAVRLKQQGQMRRTPEEKWMPTEAEQYFSIDPPGFIWKAKVDMVPAFSFSGRDKYMDGKGNMLIKFLSLFPVVDGKGPELDQGTLLRYLGEICWFPSAALAPYITWEAIDSSSAKATMSYKGVSASGVFTFDEAGRMTQFRAQRYMGAGETAVLKDWYIPAEEWKEFQGVQVPAKGGVIWQLESGDFNYYQWEVTDIEYNKPELWKKDRE
ncbi:MAG: hypothetical protein H6563_11780 [Lewinellaceae bacterium]|nr:hypothetical protein [Lewinellaceae bacterium]